MKYTFKLMFNSPSLFLSHTHQVPQSVIQAQYWVQWNKTSSDTEVVFFSFGIIYNFFPQHVSSSQIQVFLQKWKEALRNFSAYLSARIPFFLLFPFPSQPLSYKQKVILRGLQRTLLTHLYSQMLYALIGKQYVRISSFSVEFTTAVTANPTNQHGE